MLPEIADDVEHLLGLAHAERGSRFIEDDDAVAPEQGAGDREALALAARHALGRDVDRGDLHLQRVEHLAGLVAHLLVVDEVEEPGERVGRELLAAEINVLVGAHRVDEREVLVDGLDPGIHRILRPAELDGLAVGVDFATGRLEDAREYLEQRRFAGAVVADETEDLVAIEAQRCIGKGNDGSEVARDMARLEHGPHSLPHRTSPRSIYGTCVPLRER